MTLFRFQRGTLEDSMKTCVEVANLGDLIAAIAPLDTAGGAHVKISPYGFDKRNGWDTHIVTLNGNAVGFTNGHP